MKNEIKKIVLHGFVLFMFAACGDGTNSDYELLENDACFPLAKKMAEGLKNARVNLFVETSGSMSGFMSAKGTDFQKEIWSVAEELEGKMKDGLTIFQVRSKSEPLRSLSLEDFRQPLNTGGFVSSKSTDIPEMLDSMFNKSAKGTVSVLISDLIFSPENGNAAQFSQITTDIKKRFSGPNKASILLGLRSDFYQKQKISGSPYYIWVIGESVAVNAVAEVIKGVLEGSVDEAGFGIFLPRPRYSILPSVSQVGNAFPLACSRDGAYYTYQDYSDEEGSELKFWLGLDFSSLPGYMQSSEYLSKYLVADAGAASAALIQIKTVSDLKNKGDKDIASHLGLTHMLQIRMDQIGNGALLSLNLERHSPLWIDKISLDKENGLRQQTFGLKKMTNGLEGAQNKDKPVSAFASPFKIFITKN